MGCCLSGARIGQAKHTKVATLEEIWKTASEASAKLGNVEVKYSYKQNIVERIPGTDISNDIIENSTLVHFAMFDEYRSLTLCRQIPGDEVPPFTYVFDGRLTFTVGNGLIQIEVGKNRQCELGELYVSEILNVAYSDKAIIRQDNTWQYPHCIRPLENQRYKVLPRKEEIDGHLCHVLVHTKLDTLWVDEKIGFAPRKRERCAIVDGDENILFYSYDYLDYSEVASKAWVPKRAVRYHYALPQSPKQFWNKVTVQTDFEVEEIQIGKLSESDFDLVAPEGWTVMQPNSKNPPFRVPGDRSVVLSQLSKNIRLPINNTWRWWAVGGFFTLVLIVGICLKFRQKR